MGLIRVRASSRAKAHMRRTYKTGGKPAYVMKTVGTGKGAYRVRGGPNPTRLARTKGAKRSLLVRQRRTNDVLTSIDRRSRKAGTSVGRKEQLDRLYSRIYRIHEQTTNRLKGITFVGRGNRSRYHE